MQICRELELRQAERCVQSGSTVRSKTNKSSKPNLVRSLSEDQKNFARAIDPALRITTSSRDIEIREPCKLNAVVATSGVASGHAGHAEHDQKFPPK